MRRRGWLPRRRTSQRSRRPDHRASHRQKVAQYQPWELLKPHALQGEPYRSFMYSMPQVIWVAGLVRQSSPALAILLAGQGLRDAVRARGRVGGVDVPVALADDDVVEALVLVVAVVVLVLQDLLGDVARVRGAGFVAELLDPGQLGLALLLGGGLLLRGRLLLGQRLLLGFGLRLGLELRLAYGDRVALLAQLGDALGRLPSLLGGGQGRAQIATGDALVPYGACRRSPPGSASRP